MRTKNDGRRRRRDLKEKCTVYYIYIQFVFIYEKCLTTQYNYGMVIFGNPFVRPRFPQTRHAVGVFHRDDDPHPMSRQPILGGGEETVA